MLAHSGSDKAAIVEIGVDGALAGEVAQASSTATGLFPHQARFDRAGRNVIVPGLALNGGDGTLTVFRFDQGQLTRTQTITFPPGLGARHLEYA